MQCTPWIVHIQFPVVANEQPNRTKKSTEASEKKRKGEREERKKNAHWLTRESPLEAEEKEMCVVDNNSQKLKRCLWTTWWQHQRQLQDEWACSSPTTKLESFMQFGYAFRFLLFYQFRCNIYLFITISNSIFNETKIISLDQVNNKQLERRHLTTQCHIDS